MIRGLIGLFALFALGAVTRVAIASPEAPSPTTRTTLRLEARTEPLDWRADLAVLIYNDDGTEPTRVSLKRMSTPVGFYSARTYATAGRYLDVELVSRAGGVDTALWRRVLPADSPSETTLSFLVDEDGPRARRVAWLPWLGGGMNAGNEVSLVLAFGWGGLCFLYVGWLANRARRPA